MAALEVEARDEFLARLIQRVVDFLPVDFGDDVKGRHFDKYRVGAEAQACPAFLSVQRMKPMPGPDLLSSLAFFAVAVGI